MKKLNVPLTVLKVPLPEEVGKFPEEVKFMTQKQVREQLDQINGAPIQLIASNAAEIVSYIGYEARLDKCGLHIKIDTNYEFNLNPDGVVRIRRLGSQPRPWA